LDAFQGSKGSIETSWDDKTENKPNAPAKFTTLRPSHPSASILIPIATEHECSNLLSRKQFHSRDSQNKRKEQYIHTKEISRFPKYPNPQQENLKWRIPTEFSGKVNDAYLKKSDSSFIINSQKTKHAKLNYNMPQGNTQSKLSEDSNQNTIQETTHNPTTSKKRTTTYTRNTANKRKYNEMAQQYEAELQTHQLKKSKPTMEKTEEPVPIQLKENDNHKKQHLDSGAEKTSPQEEVTKKKKVRAPKSKTKVHTQHNHQPTSTTTNSQTNSNLITTNGEETPVNHINNSSGLISHHSAQTRETEQTQGSNINPSLQTEPTVFSERPSSITVLNDPDGPTCKNQYIETAQTYESLIARDLVTNSPKPLIQPPHQTLTPPPQLDKRTHEPNVFNPTAETYMNVTFEHNDPISSSINNTKQPYSLEIQQHKHTLEAELIDSSFYNGVDPRSNTRKSIYTNINPLAQPTSQRQKAYTRHIRTSSAGPIGNRQYLPTLSPSYVTTQPSLANSGFRSA